MYRLFLTGFLLIIVLSAPTAWAEGTELVRTPSTIFGPSGLLFTQSTDTLLPGEIEVGMGVAYEHSSTDPDYLINEVAATVTFGILDWAEVSARIPYVYNFESHGTESDGLQGGELSLKWRFFNQGEYLGLPAAGFSLTYFSPLGSKIDEFGVVDSWGLKGLLLASAEVDLSPSLFHYYYVGLYAAGGIFIRDRDNPAEEKHGLIDLGIALPLIESRRLQLILEANSTVRNQIPLQGNYTAITGALRYVTPSFQLTGGVQHRLKRDEEIEDTDPDRFVFQASYLF